MEGSARSSHLFDAHLPRPHPHHNTITPLGRHRTTTFRRLQPDLTPVRQERSRLQATLDHRDDDPRLMMGASGSSGSTVVAPPCHAPCSSTSLSQRLRRAVINDDLPTARRLCQRAIAEATSATNGAATVAGRSSASSSRGAIVRNITTPRPPTTTTSSRRVPHYPRGSLEAETHLSHLTSLELAIMYGCSLGMVEWLLDMGHEEGPDEWTRDEWGRSVPHLAAIAGRADVLAAYCSRFDARDVADLLDTTTVPTSTPTPSSSSTSNPSPPVVSLPTHGRTPLHDAAMRGYDAVVLVLLSRGSDPRRLDGYGNTALHYASSFGHLTTLQILMDAAAAPPPVAGVKGGGGGGEQGAEQNNGAGSDEEQDSDDEVEVGGSSSVSSALFGIKNDGGFSAADYAFTMSDRAALEALGRKWFADSRERERRKKAAAAERAAMKEKANAVAGVGEQQRPAPASSTTNTNTSAAVNTSTTPNPSTRPTRRASTLERLKSGAKDVVSGAVVAIASSSPRSPRASSPRPPTSPTPTPRATSPRAAAGSSSSPPGSPSRRGSTTQGMMGGSGSSGMHPRLAAVAGPPVGFTSTTGGE